MSFKINPVEGTVAEIDVDLSTPSQHEREEFVIEEVKKAINHIVTSLGGYLSVSCNGNINPVEGETGDVVNIYITSLPNPVNNGPIMPLPPKEESSQLQPSVTPENQGSVHQTGYMAVEPSLNPEGKTNEEIEKEAQENITNAPLVEPAIEPSPVPMPEPSNLPHVTPAGVEESPVIQENTATTAEPTTTPDNQAEIAPEVSPETPAPATEPISAV